MDSYSTKTGMAEPNRDSGLQHSSASSLLSSQTPEGSSTQQETYDDKYPSKGPRKPAWVIYNSVVVISGVAPVVVVIVWLALTRKNGAVFTTFAGEKIGGKFNQSQAKAVDVVCSAILAPLFMALLNYFWFGSARVSAVNEHHTSNHAGVPLSAILAASNTTSGSYDLINVQTLLRGKTWRLGFLAALALLSALAKTAISNIIAYEAFSEDISNGQTSVLRYFSNATIDSTRVMPGNINLEYAGLGLTLKQTADVANRIAGLLNGLSFMNATSDLNNGAYIGTNSTKDSMNSLPPNVVKVFNVPRFCLTVDCMATQPDRLTVGSMGSYTTVVNAYWDTKLPNGQWQSKNFAGYYPGTPEDMQGGTNDDRPFVAFSLNGSEVYVASLVSFNYSSYTVTSPFGEIKPGTTNLTASGFTGTKSIMTYYGIRCSLNCQDGFLNYTRGIDQRWSLSTMGFSNKTTRIPSFLINWQTVLNYRSPRSTLSGIGPALIASTHNGSCSGLTCFNVTDFQVMAFNYLYASAESQRIFDEISASNVSKDNPDNFYKVLNTVTEEYYCITYIPAVLIAGLLGLFAAAMITFTMAVYTSKTYSARSFRKVDALRLIIDSIDGLQDTIATSDIAELPHSELEKWTPNYQVLYSKVNENGQIRVKLSHSEKT